MSARKRGAAGGGDGRQVPPGTTTHGAHLSSQEFCSGPPPACAQSKPRRAARRTPTRRDVTKKGARESDQKGQEAAAMATSSPPMTPPSLRRLPSGNLAPGRHRHSQTAVVSSRRGDEHTRAQKLSLTASGPAAVGSLLAGRVLNSSRASHWCPSRLPTRPAAKMPDGGRRRARAYLRRNPTFPLDVEPWGGRRCAALPRYVESPATTVAYAISTLGPRAAVRPKSPCASCAALLWQTAPRRAI
jgi:hypothetical protein